MRWLIALLLMFSLAVAASLAARYGEGYAMLVYPPYRIEISLVLLVLVLVASFVGFYWLARLLAQVMRLPEEVTAYRRHRRQAAGQEAMRGAWEALLEGRYGRCARLAALAYGAQEAPALAALTAARASHLMSNRVARSIWLGRAEEDGDAARNARLATQAEFALDEQQFEQARGALRELHATGPKHLATLRLLLRSEQGLEHWDEVRRLLRLLEKRGAMAPATARQMRTIAIVETLRQQRSDAQSLRECWRILAREDRTMPSIAACAAQLFVRLGECGEAHRIIADALAVTWSQELVLLYGKYRYEDAQVRLETAEAWLATQPRDAALLLTLGRLCVYCERWDQARNCLEASLSVQPTRAAHMELALLAARAGRAADAARHHCAAADALLRD